MPRPKKDAKPLNIKLDAAIHEKLEQYCRETGENKTITVEKVLDQYLTGYFEREKLNHIFAQAKDVNKLAGVGCKTHVM